MQSELFATNLLPLHFKHKQNLRPPEQKWPQKRQGKKDEFLPEAHSVRPCYTSSFNRIAILGGPALFGNTYIEEKTGLIMLCLMSSDAKQHTKDNL